MSRLQYIILLASLLPLSGCVIITGSGEFETEHYAVDEIHDSIAVCCGFELYLEEGEPSLSIRADDNILDEIVVHTRGDQITIEYDRPAVNYYPSRPVEVHATLADVSEVTISGGGLVEAEPIEASLLRVLLSGGSDADFHALDVGELRLQASGGSQAHMTGEVGTQRVELSGGSEYDAFQLRSTSADIIVSGGSRAEVTVSQELDVEASGGSVVVYSGDPKVSRSVSGGSKVRSVD